VSEGSSVLEGTLLSWLAFALLYMMREVALQVWGPCLLYQGGKKMKNEKDKDKERKVIVLYKIKVCFHTGRELGVKKRLSSC